MDPYTFHTASEHLAAIAHVLCQMYSDAERMCLDTSPEKRKARLERLTKRVNEFVLAYTNGLCTGMCRFTEEGIASEVLPPRSQ